MIRTAWPWPASRDALAVMVFLVRAAPRVGALVLCCATARAGASPAEPPLPTPPPDLVERTRGAWIDIYRSWLDVADGEAMPVDPGPAFCVGSDGFAVIDQNAVAGALHLFSTIRGRGPFAARTRAFDPGSGLAAIQVHPETMEGVRCLRRVGDDAPPVAKGDVLFALGPGSAEATALRVQKASPEVLSFAGGLQDTFLAGSPLVDADGLLRGVLVAGTSSGTIGREHAKGPLAGLAKWRRASGAIPSAATLSLLEQVRKQQADGMPVPPPGPVVRGSEGVFPRTLRRPTGVTAQDLALYSAKTEEVGVEFLTPASLDAQVALEMPVYAPGRTFFRWSAHTEMWEPMVAVQQSPRFEWTSGSKAAAVLSVIFAIPTVLSGHDPSFRASYTFPRSEAAIALERGGERIPPLDSFVDCFEDYVVLEKEPGVYDPRKVRGCRTFYLFPPEALSPGADVVVRIAEDRRGETAVVPVRPETQARIAADFAPWRATLREGASAGSARAADAVIAPMPPSGTPYATRSLQGNPELRVTRPAGCTFVVTLVQRDGEPAIRIPVVFVKFGPIMAYGFVYASRDAISFEPILDEFRKYAFTFPRAEVKVSTTNWPRLHIKAHGKKRLFNPAFEVTQKLSMGEVFGAVMKEAGISAVKLAAILLGDFDRALRAFEAPETVEVTAAPPMERSAPGGELRREESPKVE